ncbi:MAG: nicotinamide mononucleotide transporter [Pyrinomonadaceae bacterium]
MQFYGIDWLATVCGLTGVYLLGNKNKTGFLVFMLASLSWIAVGVLIGSFAIIIGSSIFFMMHLRGWFNWSKEKKI